MSTWGFLYDLDDIWLEALMERERGYHLKLHHVVLSVLAIAPALAPSAAVDPNDPLVGAQP